MINVAHDTKMMQGVNPRGRSFTKGADPTKNTKNTRGNTRGNTRETLKPTRYGHTYARSMNTKGDT